MRSNEPLRFGRMYYRQISGDGQNFGFPYGNSYTLAFSRLLYPQETLIAYNVSGQPRNDRIIIDATLHADGTNMTFLYGQSGQTAVKTAPDGSRFVQLNLAAHKFVILS